MSKHQILTNEEFANFIPNPRTIKYLKKLRCSLKIDKSEMNILDWGCGRGREVLWLRENGYNAFGVDIDSEPITNGLPLFREKGYIDNPLHKLIEVNLTDFPGNFFHFTFSNQVFEHVEDIEGVDRELYRITKCPGEGLHIYPSHHYINEGHLYMPFIHWLPKNGIRKFAIYTYLLCGKEPYWKDYDNLSIKNKANKYFYYSINKTFYRHYKSVNNTFNHAGFKVNFETINHPKLQKHRLLSKFSDYRLTKNLMNYFLLTYKVVELRIIKD